MSFHDVVKMLFGEPERAPAPPEPEPPRAELMVGLFAVHGLAEPQSCARVDYDGECCSDDFAVVAAVFTTADDGLCCMPLCFEHIGEFAAWANAEARGMRAA